MQSLDSLRVAGKLLIRVELRGVQGIFVSAQVSVDSLQLSVKCGGPAGGPGLVV